MAALFGATIYQMMVVVPAFTSNLPQSMVDFSAGPGKTAAFRYVMPSLALYRHREAGG